MWDSPWGRGYPGWHIECSAMSMFYLGEQFDIHCGGIDAIPVHHTNEIAQSEAATGKKWVNYWMHGEFLLTEKGKMSKSSGEFLTIPLLQSKGFDSLDYRYFCLGAHYRTQLQFSIDGLAGARASRLGLMERVAALGDKVSEKPSESAKKYMESFDEFVCNDLGMARGLSVLWGLLKDPDVSDPDKVYALRYMDEVLGLQLDKACQVKKEETIPAEMAELLAKRTEAKKNKNWAEADAIRAQIESLGYTVKDTPQGPTVVKK